MRRYTIMTYWHSIYQIAKQTTTNQKILGLLAIVCTVMGFHFLIGTIDTFKQPDSLTKDFPQEYYLARTFLDGSDPYLPIYDEYEKYIPDINNWDGSKLISIINGKRIGLYNQETSHTQPTPHPPTIGFLLAPIGFLSYDNALNLWWVIQILLLFGSIYIGLRTNNYRYSFYKSILLTIILYCWFPVITETLVANLEILILFLLSLCLFFAIHNHQRSKFLAGICWGLSLMLKPLATLLAITFILRKETTIIFSASLTVCTVLALTVWRYGINVLLNYYSNVVPSSALRYQGYPSNLSMLSIPYTLLENTTIARVVSVLLVSLAIIFVLLFHRRYDRAYPEQFGAAIISSVLISPISWIHYWTIFLIPMLAIKYRELSSDLITFLSIIFLFTSGVGFIPDYKLIYVLYPLAPFFMYYLANISKPFREDNDYIILKSNIPKSSQ